MMKLPRRHPATLFLLAALAAAACGTDTTGPPEHANEPPPTMADVVGDYHATELMGGGYDVLALGGSMALTLGSDGSLSGTLFIPAAAAGGEEVQADMVGTFTLSGSTLTFHQDADTFVRDATWTWSQGVISGTWSGSGGSATVRLEH